MGRRGRGREEKRATGKSIAVAREEKRATAKSSSNALFPHALLLNYGKFQN